MTGNSRSNDTLGNTLGMPALRMLFTAGWLLAMAVALTNTARGQTLGPDDLKSPDDYFSGDAFYVDGVRYADFTYAGVPGGIPRLEQARQFNVSDYEGTDRQRVQAAADAAAKAGGGVVYLPAGTYRFDDFVRVTADNIVIRGAGPDRTRIVFQSSSRNDHNHGALSFHGKGTPQVYHRVVEAAEHGDRMLVLDADHGYKPGDFIQLRVHQDHGIVPFGFYNHKYALYREGNIDNYMHQTIIEIAAVDGPRLVLSQPLRVRFIGTPADVERGKLSTHVRPIRMIRDCGVEDLTIETEKFADKMYTSSVAFTSAYRCWVRNVKTIRTGSLPVQFRHSKNVEIRDCDFDGAWNIGGGGNGYLVFWTVTDGLMADVNTRELRHAPNLQAWSNGCVIQGGLYRNNDVQWHTRWTCENLMEGVTMISDENDDAYYGLFSTELYTNIPGHEPHLQGNVFYGGDIELRRAGPRGAVLGGLYKDWVFAYSRIVNTNDKPVVELGDWCDGVVFKGNHFGMRKFGGRPNEYGVDFKPGFDIKTKRYGNDPSHNKNVVFHDNTFFGLPADRMFRTRYYIPTANTNSVAEPDAKTVPKPEPYIASLYAYQKVLKAARPDVRITRLIGASRITVGGVAESSPIYGSPSKVELFWNGQQVGEIAVADAVFEFTWTLRSVERGPSDHVLIRARYGNATFVDRFRVGQPLGQE